MRLLHQSYTYTVILLLSMVVGLSIALYVAQVQHGQIINEESRAVQRLEVTDRAALILAEQREEVAASLLKPIDRSTFTDQTARFQALMRPLSLAITPADRQLQHDIQHRQRRFAQQTLALPIHPSPAQVQAIRTQGSVLFAELMRYRTRHAVNLAILHTSEIEQRALSLIMIIVTNGVIVSLALAGLILQNRLGRRQSEAAALRATDKLRREFIAFTAHELRNPASAIQTGISLLRDPSIDEDLRQQVVASITRSADALTRLIYNLLAMGRTEEGRLQLHRIAIRLPSLFDSIIAELSAYHQGIEKRIQLNLPDIRVTVDPDYLKLVIANIIDNAVKYSPPKSMITISGEAGANQVIVHIHNTGPGIPREELPKIFEMYETSGTAPYSLRRGVGLGLYMARLLIEAHGGKIWAESQPGEGAMMSFTLPIVKEE